MMITIVPIIINTYIVLGGYQYCPSTLPHCVFIYRYTNEGAEN